MLKLFRRTTLIASMLAVTASAGLAAASAQAKTLVLSTPGHGPYSSLEGTLTSTAGSLSFDEQECGTRWPDILKLKFKIDEFGGGFTGSASELDAFGCSLPSGEGVTVEPDPHPWLIKLTPSGKAQISGNGQKVMLLARIGDEECTYGAGKINMRFVVAGPLHPVPLEPGDPAAVKYRLVKGISGAACPSKAAETLMFDATAGDPANEEQVFDEA